MVQNKHMPWISILVSLSLSLSLSLSPIVELRRTSTTIAMSFIFLRSCFMGFIFFFLVWFWLWVHLIFVVLVMGSSDFLRFRIHLSLSLRLSLSLHLDGLDQIQEEGRRWFRENEARSRPSSWPKWSLISDWPLSLLHGFSFFLFFFLLLGCGFDNDLIMVGLWVAAYGGCGLWARWWWCWVVGSDSGGGGVGGNTSWVSFFFFFFASWLCVLFDFDLLVVWKMRGIFGLDS